ncbi:hypothetical protein MPTK1_2g08580 [Marchantia polymorpha subsp. ruderalis]|uniref:Uncharacterized protein n=2 Tax=Marchantia polymorpha TaxID=3197 RepID=A0A176WLA1_MARPO|nr:hypothetical protein AXG93_1193s1160 [Marchantia polymorpha subsp. ruderalis]PTQ45348.1 hypothetical protein MARPO_0015s0143 [Marchantia polymorpha]PTQ45349.1 hypothetical protein MARPO_0015s0143 [Marchantia polymorpha]BBN01581.1 hypothetical protein Mp_2g08580 [Marchantia polymorpha subsp. ruderalis]BBN01582.1 hypothetical protein Mp_2g08580 [Marchantia polymorpha subsp. ruderalis]|eukprot:PTQ45348.1 hypothetical protein MARPO_0015s0143 [Marchantia polymorpha]
MPSTLSCSRLWTISQQCTRPPRVSALSFGHGHGIQELGLGRKRSNVCIQYERQKTNSAQVCRSQAPESSGATASPGDEDEPEVIGLNKEALEEFAELNLGAWSGQFLQFDASGTILQRIPTVLRANTYGKGTDVALLQTLNIKQPRAQTRTLGESEEPMWADYKLDETNLFTVERRQQIGYFPGEKAYCLIHQTAEMLEKVLRAGVLGDDDDEDEEYPLGIKLPSRRPALVSESCLYSEDGLRRVRAFHVLDPRGLLDVIACFVEKKVDGTFLEENDLLQDDVTDRVEALLGRWEGHAVTRRTGMYGATIAEGDVTVSYDKMEDGRVTQEFTSTSGKGLKIKLTGTLKGSVFAFDGGLQTVLLPGGISITSPISVGRSVGRSQSFYFEFSWMESPGKRRRLLRTHDTDGLVVSTTLTTERKV